MSRTGGRDRFDRTRDRAPGKGGRPGRLRGAGDGPPGPDLYPVSENDRGPGGRSGRGPGGIPQRLAGAGLLPGGQQLFHLAVPSGIQRMHRPAAEAEAAAGEGEFLLSGRRRGGLAGAGGPRGRTGGGAGAEGAASGAGAGAPCPAGPPAGDPGHAGGVRAVLSGDRGTSVPRSGNGEVTSGPGAAGPEKKTAGEWELFCPVCV